MCIVDQWPNECTHQPFGFICGRASAPSAKAAGEVWKIDEDFKYFTEYSEQDNEPIVPMNIFNEIIGDQTVDALEPATRTQQHGNDDEIAGASDTIENVGNSKKSKLEIRTAVTPRLTMRQLNAVHTYAAIHLDSSAFTWTSFRVDRSDKVPTITVVDSCYEKTGYEKMQLGDIIGEFGMLVKNIPVCDLYVIENISQFSFRSMIMSKQVKDLLQMQQTISIVASLLSTRNAAESYVKSPNVVFIHRNVMGKYFKLFIGNETVSTEAVMKYLLDKRKPPTSSYLENRDITFETDILLSFKGGPRVKREYLGKTLLIGVSFFRLNILAK